ncbi:spermatogenesis-associated protein 5-like protein 1 isoform X1 [Mobula hypostoma]|uniref:spermatogenesis-associated protein 5-like protein 1 isoform X1 n=1 Tax=Mobula hypostoma TaxID=723540 RepID=UPI002FC346DA
MAQPEAGLSSSGSEPGCLGDGGDGRGGSLEPRPRELGATAARMEGPGLRLLPPEPRDRGSQRCRLGPRALAVLGVRLGGPLRVCVAGGLALCSAWPRADLADGFMQLDAKCASPGFPERGAQGLSLGLGQLQAVGCSRARRVCVRAVVAEPGGAEPPAQLVRALLKGVYLSAGLVVRVSGPEASAWPGALRLLEVRWLDPPAAGAALLAAGAEVQVAEVLSLERYRAEIRGPAEASAPGPEPALTSLREALAWPLLYPEASARLGLDCPRGVLLIGPPGVGKSRLLRCLARELGASVLEASASALLGPRPGDSELRLRRLVGQAGAEAKRRPCLLFVDQLDAAFPRRTGRNQGAEHRLLAQLLGLLDNPERRRWVLVGATDRPEALDPALRRPGRFDREVVIGVPTMLQRRAILGAVTTLMPVSAQVCVSWLAEATGGYVGADLTALCREAALQVIRRASQSQQDSVKQQITLADFQEALKVIYPSSLRSSIGLTDFRPVHWDQIGGLDEVKLKLRQSVEWPLRYPEAFVRMGVKPCRGILLYGPPGCAKTTLVKASASSCRCSLLSVSGAELFSPFVGDSEKALAEVFRQARAASPSILFLDEIDSIVGSRSGDAASGHSAGQRVLSVLLNEMDGIGHPLSEGRGTRSIPPVCEAGQAEEHERKLEFQEICNKEVIVIAATNRPDLLDDALLRPGRFDQMIFVPAPDEEARLSILRICTSRTPLDGVCLRELAALTVGFTGADLHNLCKEAVLLSLQENGLDATAVFHSHFIKCLQSFKPSLTEQQLQFYNSLFSAQDTGMCVTSDPG